MQERVQKLLANAGYFSRRGAETAIKEGRLKFKNKIIELGDKCDIDTQIYLDDKPIDLHRFRTYRTQVLMMNKQAGVICSRKDPEKRKSVFEYLPTGQRWVMVGRLDFNTSGLLLWTNNGELANRLMHPSYQIDREYAVRVLGEVKEEDLKKLIKGVELDDGFIASFKKINFAGGEGANRWYKVVLQEGKYREVRRLWEALGFKVSRLIRIRYGDVKLIDKLKPNKTEALKPKQVDALLGLVRLPKENEKEKKYK
ncbi:Ribosomal large subunit pseudouridine synthase B [hydrothermal vent metagenome]|uniref:Ribosomal large subunit pseudouridine synthase B n=1 Tax=hydrothermal vent metagenome TaxID=652676 RepID=A0A1W1CJQ5_9ZZZZ